MVSKTSDATGTAKKSVAPAAKKSVSKSATKKVSVATKKTVKAKPAAKPVEAKVSVAPVEKVLEIKAKNEDKKAAKVVKTTKVAEEKKCCCGGTCKCGIGSSWARAYKNMFNFKGRTSRYEFWGFILLNFIFAIIMTGAFVAMISFSAVNSVLTYVGLGGMAAFIIVEFFTYLSLFARRLHDSGFSAWKGTFRPAILYFLLFVLVAIGAPLVLEKLGDDLSAITAQQNLSIIGYLFALLVVAIFMVYYLLKIVMVASFFDEDDDNIYGEAHFNDRCCKVKAFKYAILYCTIVTIAQPIIEQVVSYLQYINQMY